MQNLTNVLEAPGTPSSGEGRAKEPRRGGAPVIQSAIHRFSIPYTYYVHSVKCRITSHLEEFNWKIIRSCNLLLSIVYSYKLLGLHVTDSLQWNEHVSSLYSRAAQRLHFLKQLKRASLSSDDLLFYYQSDVRPVTENIRMRRMAHKSNPRTDQTARVYSEARHENYIRP